MTDLTEEELNRYSRHILLHELGNEGQERIKRGRVLVVGTGGLGSPVLMYLAAAGVGTIGIVDGDAVDASNLQRQIIHDTPAVGRPKVESARERIARLNPNVKVETHHEFLTAANAQGIISGYDFVVEATDNYATKLLVNDACVMAGKPFSHGSVLRFEGQAFTYVPGTACYRCIFGAPPPPGEMPTCAQVGVLGTVPGIIGTIQATETLKYLSGIGELLTDSLLTFDARTMEFCKIHARRREKCPLCGKNPTITRLEDLTDHKTEQL